MDDPDGFGALTRADLRAMIDAIQGNIIDLYADLHEPHSGEARAIIRDMIAGYDQLLARARRELAKKAASRGRGEGAGDVIVG